MDFVIGAAIVAWMASVMARALFPAGPASGRTPGEMTSGVHPE
jgi:hypothetical protein